MNIGAAISVACSGFGFICMAFSLGYTGHDEWKAWKWEQRSFNFFLMSGMFLIVDGLEL